MRYIYLNIDEKVLYLYEDEFINSLPLLYTISITQFSKNRVLTSGSREEVSKNQAHELARKLLNE